MRLLKKNGRIREMKHFTQIGSVVFILILSVAACIPEVRSTDQVLSNPQETQSVKVTRMPTDEIKQAPTAQATQQKPGYKDIGYQVENQFYLLSNGVSITEALPGSSTETVTQIFDNEAFGDLNWDGREDVAFLLTQDRGGSGTYFYIVAALKTDTGYTGIKAFFLGDRITPQSTMIENNVLIVSYLDRKPDDPFTTAPSIEVTKYLRVVDNSLVDVNP